ncbi:MAG: MBL fold metallo-hydrolase [Pirellulaceae bacterium]|nr:MBL fold metallo-hydrolase [Pirellulaceae bacterium]
MLLKYFYDAALAHASYMVGCQKTGEAIIIDPGRGIQQYLDAAADEGMKIVAAADTHIHADYVSGARELADQHGAKLYLSDEGPAEWKYLFADQYPHQLLTDGDTFSIGKVDLKVLHTPGHTPESLSFLLTDRGGGADQPMGIFTGDFVFVGSIGRPDLLEQAAGIMGTAEPGARDLFHSAQRFIHLPDYLQVWPAHGAGSACGKGLGAIPSSTVGYEKRFNPALQFTDEQEFVDYILSEQPEAPTYFAVMKRVNKVGPTVLADSKLPAEVDAKEIERIASEQMVIDAGSSSAFATAHAVGTINIPMKYLAGWAGWLVDYEKPVYLLLPREELAEATRILRNIGIENIAGFFDAGKIEAAGLRTESYLEQTPQQLAASIESGGVILVDVRGESEWIESHIPQAQRCFLANLPEKLSEFDGDCTLVFQCRSGGRSAIAASLAKAAGVRYVINMSGGINAWMEAGLPIDADTSEVPGPNHSASTSEAARQSQAVFWNAKCPSRPKEATLST